MLDSNKVNYLLYDLAFYKLNTLFKIDFKIDESGVLFFLNEKKLYAEKHFDFDTLTLESYDCKVLDLIVHLCEHKENISLVYSTLKELDYSNYFKLIYYFTNECYQEFTDEDTYGRIISKNLSSSLQNYLSIPISDILIRMLNLIFDVTHSNPFKVQFSCDYDIINYWQGISLLKKAKWFFYWFRNDKSEFLKQIISYFGSIFRLENPLLNNEMFLLHQVRMNASEIEVVNVAFILLPEKDVFFDVTIDFYNKISNVEKKFFKKLQLEGVEMGIHPSINSFEHPTILGVQLNRFHQLFGYYPSIYRSHYLKINYKKDLFLLSVLGVKEEHSFCFFDTLLFRGGITRTFRMWNPIDQKAFPIEIVPLSIMDTTIEKHLTNSKINKINDVKHKIDLCKQYGFQLSILIHNNHFSMDSKYNALKKEIMGLVKALILKRTNN
jgi:hypothetical protein